MHGTLPAPERASPPPSPSRLPLALRLALRELRGGLQGFTVFLVCLALGAAAIAGVASIAHSLTDGLSAEGRRILGADAAFSLVHREADPAERAFLARQGTVSVLASMRAMAVAPSGSANAGGSALVELKAVDAAYPTVGQVETTPARPLPELLAPRDGVFGAVADPALLARRALKTGDRITVGGAALELRAVLDSEPDRIANGIGFGPRLLTSQGALAASGLVQPGSLVRWTYRVMLADPTDAAVERVVAAAAREAPEAGWEIRSRVNADPRFARNIERFTQFLTLVGLTALLVGGVGVANAVNAFVERKRPSIAIMKSLGAPGGQVVAIYLAQVMLIAGIGTAIGLAVGAALPFLVAGLFGHLLPIPIRPALAPDELGLAALYGLLVALAFAIGPLGRARDVTVSGLFRAGVEPPRRWPRPVYGAILAASVAALVGLAVATAFDRRVALLFLAAAAASFVLLRGVALGLMALARRLPRPRNASLRLALSNLYRPGALTPSIVLSLGLGITLLVTLAVIDANLTRQLTRTLPERAPSLFFMDVPSADSARFDAFLRTEAADARIERVPMMRGRITALKDVPVAQVKATEQAAWVLDGDRGITYAAALPEGSTVTDGAWWAADHSGVPLVSFEREVASGLGLKVGDAVSVNVLGRTLTARVANLRRVDWRSLGINFVMVFSPNAFRGAPHADLATLTLSKGPDAAREATILRDVARGFPSVTSVRVKDALEAVNDVVGKLVTAIRGASAVAIAASLFVLGGALAAGHRARLYDAVILKTLGATRMRLVGAYALEYGVLGLATALFGLIAGTLAAYAVITGPMRLTFALELSGGLVAAGLAVVVTLVLGLAATWRVLGQKPAGHLRSL